MSATNRGAERREADFYPTPAWPVHRLLEAVDLPGGDWLEPCAGDGAIIRAVNQVRSDARWSAVEIRPECRDPLIATGAHGILIADFLAAAPRPPIRFDVNISNTPYDFAREFVDESVQSADHVVHLLRVNFLGSEDRYDWWMSRPRPDLYVLPNRPSFVCSVKCVGHPKEHAKLVSLVEAPSITRCWVCGGKVRKSSSDATEYAWFHWWPGATGRYEILAPTPEDVRRKVEAPRGA